MKRGFLWEYFLVACLAIIIFLVTASSLNPLAPIQLPRALKSPKVAGSADILDRAMLTIVATNTNYIIYRITNLPPDYGTAWGRKIFLNWSDDETNWHEGGLLAFPGFNVQPTNAHRFYRFNNKPLVADGVVTNVH